MRIIFTFDTLFIAIFTEETLKMLTFTWFLFKCVLLFVNICWWYLSTCSGHLCQQFLTMRLCGQLESHFYGIHHGYSTIANWNRTTSVSFDATMEQLEWLAFVECKNTSFHQTDFPLSFSHFHPVCRSSQECSTSIRPNMLGSNFIIFHFFPLPFVCTDKHTSANLFVLA